MNETAVDADAVIAIQESGIGAQLESAASRETSPDQAHAAPAICRTANDCVQLAARGRRNAAIGERNKSIRYTRVDATCRCIDRIENRAACSENDDWQRGVFRLVMRHAPFAAEMNTFPLDSHEAQA